MPWTFASLVVAGSGHAAGDGGDGRLMKDVTGALENRLQEGEVGDAPPDKADPSLFVPQERPDIFQFPGEEAVQDNYLVVPVKLFHQVRADKARPAGDDDFFVFN